MIREVFSFIEILWQERNDRVHRNNNSDTEKETLKKEVETLKLTKMYIPPKLRKLYQRDISKILAPNSPITDIRRWIRIFTKC